MTTVFAFIFALALLIAVHEYGHYRVAVACGVRVLRFSIGFGPVLWRWQRAGSATEFVIGAIPLGGYVKMLDEREAPVSPDEAHFAFNNQPLFARSAIVLAGPVANLLLAVCLYFVVSWMGVQEPKAILASPPAQSLAAQAGVRGQETIEVIEIEGEQQTIRSFEDLRWQLVQAALDGKNAKLIGHTASQTRIQFDLHLSRLQVAEATPDVVRQIGLTSPWTAPLIGELQAGAAAARDGLRPGDRVVSVDAVPIVDGAQLRELIRHSGAAGRINTQTWLVQRPEQAQMLSLNVTPDLKTDNEKTVGRIGAYVGEMPAMVTIERGFWGSWRRGVEQTAEVSALTLKMMFKIVIGQASIKNISGPITIADYAGKSASLGVIPFLVFLALISVSLGVLNLLPLPMLDGGHLMYYLWEGIIGKPVSELWQERFQRAGLGLLLLMMSVALYNDVTRLFG